MARQRFIHPEIWKDPVFGRLTHTEQVMFVGLFSLADDEGRILADPAFLKSEVFPYKDYTNKKVEGIRDAVVDKVPSVHLYQAKGSDLIALLKWGEYQKPKYAKPSKLPAPAIPEALEKPSPNVPPKMGKRSPKASPESDSDVSGADLRVGLGRDGLGRAVRSASETGEAGADERPSVFQIPTLREAS